MRMEDKNFRRIDDYLIDSIDHVDSTLAAFLLAGRRIRYCKGQNRERRLCQRRMNASLGGLF
jgi:hypothetical protein